MRTTAWSASGCQYLSGGGGQRMGDMGEHRGPLASSHSMSCEQSPAPTCLPLPPFLGRIPSRNPGGLGNRNSPISIHPWGAGADRDHLPPILRCSNFLRLLRDSTRYPGW